MKETKTNTDDPPLDLITILVWIAVLGLFVLSILIWIKKPLKEYEIREQSVVYQWEVPVLQYRTLGSLIGNNLLEEYMDMPEDQKETIECESNWNHYNKYGAILRGDAGEYGIAQFMLPTWNIFKKEAGLPDLSIHSAKDQIELMSWAFEQGEEYKKHWTCWRELYY